MALKHHVRRLGKDVFVFLRNRNEMKLKARVRWSHVYMPRALLVYKNLNIDTDKLIGIRTTDPNFL